MAKGNLDLTGKGAVEKLKKLLLVSTKIKQDQMRRILKLDEETFDDKILDWTADFRFKVDGDFVIVGAGSDVDGIIARLEAEFEAWGQTAGSGDGKI